MTTPYTYLITFLPTNQKYYGVRYAKHCNPTDLGITYFSSSKIIKELMEKYDISNFKFEVRKIFKTQDKACIWEYKVLKRLKVHLRDDYLNQVHNFTFCMYNKDIIEKVKNKLKEKNHYKQLGLITSNKRKENNFDYGTLSRKKYIITFINGENILVYDLKKYAEENNIRYDVLRRCLSKNWSHKKKNILKVELAEGFAPSL